MPEKLDHAALDELLRLAQRAKEHNQDVILRHNTTISLIELAREGLAAREGKS
jgi:hypothetical protein